MYVGTYLQYSYYVHVDGANGCDRTAGGWGPSEREHNRNTVTAACVCVVFRWGRRLRRASRPAWSSRRPSRCRRAGSSRASTTCRGETTTGSCCQRCACTPIMLTVTTLRCFLMRTFYLLPTTKCNRKSTI